MSEANDDAIARKKMNVLRSFLRSVFYKNCHCFDKSCDIKNANAKGDNLPMPSAITTLLQQFRSKINEQRCVTLYDADEERNCSVIQNHLSAMQTLGLIEVYGDSHEVCDFNQTFPSTSNIDLSSEPSWKIYLHKRLPFLWTVLKCGHQKERCFCTPLLKDTRLRQLLSREAGLSDQVLNDSDIHTFVQMLFWYFRKAVVDHLVMLIGSLGFRGSECKAISVGSTRITSDYDLTVQGLCSDDIIKRFHVFFWHIFGNTSDQVFDTNLYGSSFVVNSKVPNNPLFVKWNCALPDEEPQEYYYATTESVPSGAIVDQHLWAMLKVCTALHKFVTDQLDIVRGLQVAHDTCDLSASSSSDLHQDYLGQYSVDMDNLNQYTNMVRGAANLSSIQKKFTLASMALLSVLRNDVLKTTQENVRIADSGSMAAISPRSPQSPKLEHTTKDAADIYNRFPFSRIQDQNEDYRTLTNLISAYNIYGNETYYSRGAFMHVVMNSQTCSRNKVPLHRADFEDSFLENFADYLAHGFKTKYKDRMMDALDNIVELETKSSNRDDDIVKSMSHIRTLLSNAQGSDSTGTMVFETLLFVSDFYDVMRKHGFSLTSLLKTKDELFRSLNIVVPQQS